MKKVKYIILTTCLLLLGLTASADEGGFEYKRIDIKATIGADNTWDITETFTLNFTEPRHGYYRYIPEVFYLRRKMDDGSEPLLKFVSDVEMIDVDKKHDYGYENDNVVIKIGDPDKTVTGLQTYTIHYKYHYPSDRCDKYDEIFHTFIGSNLNQQIDTITLEVKSEKALPADFAEQLKIYSGYFENKGNSGNIEVEYEDGVIYGYGTDIEPHTAVTIYATLPEGFFTDENAVSSGKCYFFYYLSIALLVVVIFFEITRRHPLITRDVQYYPPKDMSPAEVGTVIDTVVDNVDIASIIPWWASQGRIKIKNLNEKEGKKAKLEITKVRSLPSDAPSYLSRMDKMLFKNGNTVILDELENDPEEYEGIKNSISKVFTGEKELTKTHSSAWTLLLIAITSTLALTFSCNEQFLSLDMLLLVTILYTVPFCCTWFISWALYSRGTCGWKTFLGLTIPSAFFLFVEMLFYSGPDNINSYGYFLEEGHTLLIFGLSYVATVFSGRLTTNTQYRADMMGKLLGLKEFIELAERPRLEEILEGDPDYFYKILPYAMVFDLADKWGKKFENIQMKRPDWYAGDALMTGNMLASTFSRSVLSSTEKSIASVGVSTSSGGSSGGFSGGGGGGGGGGSW